MLKPNTITRCMAGVRSDFAEYKHYPSEAMFDAMELIPRTAVKIINGNAEPKLYLSKLDCGVGKTTTLKHTIKAVKHYATLLTGPYSMIICLNRLSQIERMIVDLKLDADEYAVLVREGEPAKLEEFEGTEVTQLGLGRDNINNAPILLTTHAMLETRLARKTWADVEDFYYQGAPRILKIWDESIFVRDGITFTRQDLMQVGGHVASVSQMVDDFLHEMRTTRDNAVVRFPDFEERSTLQRTLNSLTMATRQSIGPLLQDVWYLSDKPVRIRKGNDTRFDTFLQMQTILDGVFPIIVLDASARVRQTYNYQHRADNSIEFLGDKDSVKKFDKVTVRFEYGRCGKEQGGDKYKAKIRSIAEVIRAHPDKKALVLHHKLGDRVPPVEADIRNELWKMSNEDKGGPICLKAPDYDISFCTWGHHTASNAYKECNLIIAASIFRLPDPKLEARGRAMAKREVEETYQDYEFKVMRRGEMLHDLLQGLSRGTLRNCQGDQAEECLVYMMIDRNPKINQKMIKKVLFPGCTVKYGWSDDPKKAKLAKQDQEALTFILEKMKVQDKVYLSEICEAMNITKKNIGRTLKAIAFHLSDNGLRGFRRRGDPGSYISWDKTNKEEPASVAAE